MGTTTTSHQAPGPRPRASTTTSHPAAAGPARRPAQAPAPHPADGVARGPAQRLTPQLAQRLAQALAQRLTQRLAQAVALALALVAATGTPAVATDVPVGATQLTFQWEASGAQRFVFLSEDTALPFPQPGGPDDPAAATPGGLVVEVFSTADDSVATYAVPRDGAAPGWTPPGVLGRRYLYAHSAAPRSPSLVHRLRWKKNRRFRVASRFVGLDQVAPRGSVAVRVTSGSTRFCTVFPPSSIQREGRRGFFAGPVAAPPIADCSDASLGTSPGLSSDWYDDAWCEDDFPPVTDEVDPGHSLLRVTLRDPLAVCNDGSPAVFYIRPAPVAGEHADDWIIWLAGGSSCGSPGECGDRWCQHQPGPYSARTMSTRWDPPSKDMQGIFSQRQDNQFRDFNVVVASYCSSDEWLGGHSIDVPAGPSEADPQRTLPAYRIPFHGGYIATALMLALKDGVAADADPTVTLPPLSSAARVLFSGSSAGAAGAVSLANRVADFVHLVSPDAEVRLVADAIARPYEGDGVVLPDVVARAAWGPPYEASRWRGGYLDFRCLEAHPSEPEICTQKAHVLFHHVELPAFSQFDLADNTVGPWIYPAFPPFVEAARALYQGIPSLPEPGGEEVAPTDFAWMAPRCGHHVTLSGTEFYTIGIGTDLGAVTMHDALWAWWNDAAIPRLVDDVDSPSTCPE